MRFGVLLSGGLDSAVLLADLMTVTGDHVSALTLSYGQRHSAELVVAGELAKEFAVPHTYAKVELPFSVPLTGDGEIQTLGEMHERSPAYVPGRNSIFIAMALGWAEHNRLDRICIAANADDARGFPDCRDEFFNAWQTVSDQAFGAIDIAAPYTVKTKANLVRLGFGLGVPFEQTVSCYYADPKDYTHCGRCDACTTRLVAFEQCGLEDPQRYRVRL